MKKLLMTVVLTTLMVCAFAEDKVFATNDSVLAVSCSVDTSLPKGKPFAGYNDGGFWKYGTIAKLGATNSNPVIVIRTDNGNESTYAISSRNNGQILQLAIQAIANNLQVQIYVYDNCYNGAYITALYIIAPNCFPSQK